MCIYMITNPMRRGIIGRMHMTLCAAKKAAARAVKRYDHVNIEHWRDGRLFTVFSDGTTINRKEPSTAKARVP